MKVILIAILLLLVACQALDYEGHSSLYGIPNGTVITLNQDLTIPPDQAGVYIQGNRIGDRYQYDATCRLETNSVTSMPRTVKADEFVVYKVGRETQIFSGIVPGTRYASLVLMEGPHLLLYSTYIYLRSEQQPDVLRLVCGHLQDSALNPRHLTVEEIRTTLGEVMTMRLPQG